MFLSITSYNLYNLVKREKKHYWVSQKGQNYLWIYLSFSIGFNSDAKNSENLCKLSTMKMVGILSGKQNRS